jgi:CRP/FNR family transcriptional regulator, cyclic AMP receptor protein
MRKRMEERARTFKIRKGQSVIEHGSRCTEVYFLIDGELRVLLYSRDGREVSMRTFRPGQMFGELAAIDGLPRSATVAAVEPSLVLAITREDFHSCMESSASASLWLAREFASQIRALTDRVFELATLNVRNRLHCELLRLALIVGATGNRATLQPSPTHSELANRIGTHREAVTRELRELARRGIVEQNRRSLTILDFARLSELVLRLSGRSFQVYPATRSIAMFEKRAEASVEG